MLGGFVGGGVGGVGALGGSGGFGLSGFGLLGSVGGVGCGGVSGFGGVCGSCTEIGVVLGVRARANGPDAAANASRVKRPCVAITRFLICIRKNLHYF